MLNPVYQIIRVPHPKRGPTGKGRNPCRRITWFVSGSGFARWPENPKIRAETPQQQTSAVCQEPHPQPQNRQVHPTARSYIPLPTESPYPSILVSSESTPRIPFWKKPVPNSVHDIFRKLLTPAASCRKQSRLHPLSTQSQQARNQTVQRRNSPAQFTRTTIKEASSCSFPPQNFVTAVRISCRRPSTPSTRPLSTAAISR
jgi:hypothetical protein